MQRLSMVLWCVLSLSAACGEERRPPAPRGAVASAGPSAAPVATAGARAAADPFAPAASSADVRDDWRPEDDRTAPTTFATSGSNVTPGEAVNSVEATAPAAPAARARDLAAELRARVGSPAGCLSAPDALPSRIAIAITAVFGVSGRVTRAEVSAPGIPDADVRCLRQRVESVQLAPIDGAPITVSTRIEAERVVAAEPATP